MRLLHVILSAMAAATVLWPASGQSQIRVLDRRAGPTQIVGAVVDVEGRPVPNPDVLLKDSLGSTINTAVASGQGLFAIQLRRGGSFVLSVSRIGYRETPDTITCSDGEDVRVQVVLEVWPLEIVGLDVTAPGVPKAGELSFRGFQARKVEAAGFFVDEDEITRRRPSRLTDVVGRAPGAMVLRLGGRIVDVSLLRSQGSSFRSLGTCLPSIYLDGLRVREGGPSEGSALRGTTTLLNDLVQPDAVAGIEVYSGLGVLPAVFRGTGATCGVVAIWTKR